MYQEDKETKELIEKFRIDYLQSGWEIISSVSKILIIATFLIWILFLDSDHAFYWRAVTGCPFSIIIYFLVDKFYSSNKKLSEILLIMNIYSLGFLVIRGNFKQSVYSFNEFWMCFILYWQYVGIFLFLNWKKAVISFYIVTWSYIILLNIFYTNIPFMLYASIVVVCILYPITWLIISQKFKEMIILLKSNRDLIHTIRSILQVFPEGVIIRSLDPLSQETIIKFANDVASKFWKDDRESFNISNRVSVSQASDQDNPSLSLNEFLLKQEQKVDVLNSKLEECIVEIKTQTEEVKEWEIDQGREEVDHTESFNIKTTKVIWENKEGYMHVFVNTTQVKKLGEERAIRECQQIMFTSLSHDMRTPLNAFSNSLKLIDLTFDEIKKKIVKHREINESYNVLQPRLQKYFKIGEISSWLLLNLVEDILDMAKFSAKTFQLNIEPFKLKSVLKEIEFIFGFQWAEKRIGFRIHCDEDINDKVFHSDPKRLKQVLINLVSNSFKFTEKGRITITVSKIIETENLFLKFEVHDTGVGISEDDIPTLFNMFQTLPKHKNRLNKNGSGIGLNISKKIVESLGGAISIYSQEGSWTKIIFKIKWENYIENNFNEESKHEINELEVYN